MQDRYVGDIGDFVKMGLLRSIMNGRRLGLAWYRFPNESHNKDGRHIDYLAQPNRYAELDPELFSHLGKVVLNSRTIDSLLPLLPNAISYAESLDISAVPVRQRRDWRRAWFLKGLSALHNCDIIFADPDNGLVDNDDRRKGRWAFGKQIPLDEVHALATGRCAVIYHHNSRRAGGHDAEVDHWLDQIAMPTIAVRATAYSPRTFFVINPDSKTEEQVRAFCTKWKDLRIRLHSNRE